MCGIIGYLGDKQAQDILLSGLKALEYRGYDSSGMAIFHQKKMHRVRAKGNISFLEQKLVSEPLAGTMGLAHTRWATHGAPTENNAHPHKVGSITLVHNGVIENFYEFKKELTESHITTKTDTDSEVVAHLIHQEYAKCHDFKASCLKNCKQVRGQLCHFSVLL